MTRLHCSMGTSPEFAPCRKGLARAAIDGSTRPADHGRPVRHERLRSSDCESPVCLRAVGVGNARVPCRRRCGGRRQAHRQGLDHGRHRVPDRVAGHRSAGQREQLAGRHHRYRPDADHRPQPGRRQPQLQQGRSGVAGRERLPEPRVPVRRLRRPGERQGVVRLCAGEGRPPLGQHPQRLHAGRAAERRRRPAALALQRRRARQPLRERPPRSRRHAARMDPGLSEARLGQSLPRPRRPARPEPDRYPGADPARHAAARAGDAHPGAADLRPARRLGVHVDRGLLPVRLRAQRAQPVRHLLFGRGLVLRRLQRRDGRPRFRPRRAGQRAASSSAPTT